MDNLNIEKIQAEIDGAEHGSKRKIVERYAEQTGVSVDTIYRRLRRCFGRRKEISRNTRIPQVLIDEIAKMKVSGFELGLGEREISTERCIDLLQKRQVPGSDELTVSSVNRRLKKSGFRAREAYVRVEAEYANQMHQLDFSRSKYFQLAGYDSLQNDYILKASGRTLHYKEDERKLRTWLVAVIDAYSRVALARAVPATAESAIIGIEFLNFAYNREPDTHPLRYIPRVMKTDNGSFAKDRSVKAMLDSLDIQSELVTPYRKRGIQKVESVWRLLWQQFELPLALQIGDGEKITLTDYNDLLHEFMIANIETEHPVRTGTKEHLYRTSIAFHPPREIAEDLRTISFRVLRRKVRDDLTVSVDNVKYECPLFSIGKTIRVYKNHNGEMMGELIDEFRKPFALKETEGFVPVGDYEHRPHAGYRQIISAAIKEEKEKKTHEAESKINYLEPRTKLTRSDTVFSEKEPDKEKGFTSIYDARAYIGMRLPKTTTYNDVAHVFDEMIEDGATVAEIDSVINYINNQERIAK